MLSPFELLALAILWLYELPPGDKLLAACVPVAVMLALSIRPAIRARRMWLSTPASAERDARKALVIRGLLFGSEGRASFADLSRRSRWLRRMNCASNHHYADSTYQHPTRIVHRDYCIRCGEWLEPPPPPPIVFVRRETHDSPKLG